MIYIILLVLQKILETLLLYANIVALPYLKMTSTKCFFIFMCVCVSACVYMCIYIYIYNRLIGLVGRVFTNGLGDLDSITGHVIPKTLKMVLDTSLLNTQQYKVGIKDKVEQSWERSSALPYTSVL